MQNSPSEALLTATEALIQTATENPTSTARRTATLEKYCPHKPWPKQQAFLDLDCLEAFYGGAAAGGKSDTLLMAALEYVHVPSYSALILRRDFARLSLPNSIMDRARQWLYHTDAKWCGGERAARFPSGAVIQFGYIDSPDDRFRYASAEFQFIGVDEASELRLIDGDDANPYLFMFSRLRKTTDNPVPLRVRCASNPGNEGHEFLKQRFVTEEALAGMQSEGAGVYWKDGRAFVPAKIEDNPAVNLEEYTASLMHLPPLTRARLLQGDWSIRPDGIIRLDWLRRYTMRGDLLQAHGQAGERIGQPIDCRTIQRFATIDTAGTSEDKARDAKGKPPSWTVCQIWEYAPKPKWLFLRHVWRARVDWDGLKAGIRATLNEWKPRKVLIENAHWGEALKCELRGTTVEMFGTGGKGKLERSTNLQNMLESGQVFLPQIDDVPGVAAWLPILESEWLGWTGLDEETNDQIDTASMAANHVNRQGGSWGGTLPVNRVRGALV